MVNPMRQAGFTLLEVMASVAILTIVSGMLFMLAGSLNAAALSQEAKMASQDEARQGMEFIARELRQAASSSIGGVLPGPALTYRVADDVDGLGLGAAVDIGGSIELRPARTLTRDLTDANGDGQTVTQLVCIENGAVIRVVTNGLIPNEDTNNNSALDGGEDANSNGVLDRGIWFEQDGSGIRVTIQAQRRSGVRGQFMNSTLTEIIIPRN